MKVFDFIILCIVLFGTYFTGFINGYNVAAFLTREDVHEYVLDGVSGYINIEETP